MEEAPTEDATEASTAAEQGGGFTYRTPRSSLVMTAQQGQAAVTAVFGSPDPSQPVRNNPLRRSWVVALDRERRAQFEQASPEESEEQRPPVNEQVLLPSDDILDGSRHQTPLLRLRPAASHDYCPTCGGSTSVLCTPRRSSILPRQPDAIIMSSSTRPVPLPCRCHADPAADFSFVPVSPSESERVIRQAPPASLQLWLDDDEDYPSDHDDDNNNDAVRPQESAFRRVALRPKTSTTRPIQRSYSDPMYASTSSGQAFVGEHDEQDDEDGYNGDEEQPPPPQLHQASSQSSATNSPEEAFKAVACPALRPTGILRPQPSKPSSLSSSSSSSATPIPLMPVSATPESIRPLFGGLSLSRNQKTTSAPDLDEFPSAPNLNDE